MNYEDNKFTEHDIDAHVPFWSRAIAAGVPALPVILLAGLIGFVVVSAIRSAA